MANTSGEKLCLSLSPNAKKHIGATGSPVGCSALFTVGSGWRVLGGGGIPARNAS